MTLHEFQFWGQGTWSDNTIAVWPVSKRQHPRVGPEIGWLGCYFNNDGINPMHDEFFAPMGPEAPAILKVAMEEGPDVAVSLAQPRLCAGRLAASVSSHGDSRAGAYSCQAAQCAPGGTRAAARRRVRGQAGGWQGAAAVQSDQCVCTTSAVPWRSPTNARTGSMGRRCVDVTFDEILDIQLTLYEAMMRQALDGAPSSS